MSSNRQKEILPRVLQSLYTFENESAVVAAATEIKFRALLVNELDATRSSTELGTRTMQRILRQFWTPLLCKMHKCLHAWGFVPIRVVKRQFIDETGTKSTELVPIVPDLSTFRVFVEITNDAETKFTATSTIDKHPLTIYRSCIYTGPDFLGNHVHSPFGILYPEFVTLAAMTRASQSAFYQLINPTLYLEAEVKMHQPTTTTTMAGDSDLGGESIRVIERHEVNPKRLCAFEEIREQILNGEVVDPVNNLVYLAPTYRMVTHLPTAVIPPMLPETRALFDTKVASVLRVPESFLSSSNGNTLNGKHNTTASDNDTLLFRNGVTGLVEDLVQICEAIYYDIHDDRVQFILPMMSHARIDHLALLHQHGGLNVQEFSEEAKKASGISSA
jgi:hypothetical protein